MEKVNGTFKYTAATPSWRVDRQRLFPDEDIFDERPINQTASRLRVRIDPAIFTGDSVSFSCFLLLMFGGEDSDTIVVNPQGSSRCRCSFVAMQRSNVLHISMYTAFNVRMCVL